MRLFLAILQNQILREPERCFRLQKCIVYLVVIVTPLCCVCPPFSTNTQLWSIGKWTQQEPWRCGSKMLAADPLNPVNCHGWDLFVQQIPQLLDWTETWGIWRPGQHLELVVFIKPNHICSVAAEATAIRDYCFPHLFVHTCSRQQEIGRVRHFHTCWKYFVWFGWGTAPGYEATDCSVMTDFVLTSIWHGFGRVHNIHERVVINIAKNKGMKQLQTVHKDPTAEIKLQCFGSVSNSNGKNSEQMFCRTLMIAV